MERPKQMTTEGQATALPNYKLINTTEIDADMIVTGIELSSGQIAKCGRFRVEDYDGERALVTYLYNGSQSFFHPDKSSRYEIEVQA